MQAMKTCIEIELSDAAGASAERKNIVLLLVCLWAAALSWSVSVWLRVWAQASDSGCRRQTAMKMNHVAAVKIVAARLMFETWRKPHRSGGDQLLFVS